MAKIFPSNRRKEAIDLAIGELGASRALAIPTETVYGLAANAEDGKAVARIFALKNRPQFNPLICHVANMDMARSIGRFCPLATRLANEFWPGPLTLVLQRSENCAIHDLVTAGLDTVGIRWPQGIAVDIIGAFGKPLAAPSANKSGRVSPTLASHVADDFISEELVIIDDGPAVKGIESTIASVSDGEVIILRPGSITAEMLKRVVGDCVNYHDVEGKVLAPGMMTSHYAPNAPVVPDFTDCTNCNGRDTLLAFGPEETPLRKQAGHVLNLSPSSDMEEAAANIYRYLKEADEMSPARILVEPIPAIGIGIAINDRLKRAAAPRTMPHSS